MQSPEFFALVSDDVEVCVYASAGMVTGLLDEVEGWDVGIRGAWMEVGDAEWRLLQLDAGDASDESRMSFHLLLEEGYLAYRSGEVSSIHPVTASLADAGIRCKYQSSYYTDFILVRFAAASRYDDLFNPSTSCLQVEDEQLEQTLALVRACGCTSSLDASG